MYERYLGDGYHTEVRKLLGTDDELCPNMMIDAELNIGAMKMIVGRISVLNKVDNEERFRKLQSASKYILSGIICTALMSRDKKNKKKWFKKRRKLLDKGNKILAGLVNMG